MAETCDHGKMVNTIDMNYMDIHVIQGIGLRPCVNHISISVGMSIAIRAGDIFVWPICRCQVWNESLDVSFSRVSIVSVLTIHETTEADFIQLTLVFESPVLWTGKKPGTELNCNW